MWGPQNLCNTDDSTLRSALRRPFEVLDPVETTDGLRANHAKGFQLSRKNEHFFSMVRKGKHTTAVTG